MFQHFCIKSFSFWTKPAGFLNSWTLLQLYEIITFKHSWEKTFKRHWKQVNLTKILTLKEEPFYQAIRLKEDKPQVLHIVWELCLQPLTSPSNPSAFHHDYFSFFQPLTATFLPLFTPNPHARQYLSRAKHSTSSSHTAPHCVLLCLHSITCTLECRECINLTFMLTARQQWTCLRTIKRLKISCSLSHQKYQRALYSMCNTYINSLPTAAFDWNQSTSVMKSDTRYTYCLRSGSL